VRLAKTIFFSNKVYSIYAVHLISEQLVMIKIKNSQVAFPARIMSYISCKDNQQGIPLISEQLAGNVADDPSCKEFIWGGYD